MEGEGASFPSDRRRKGRLVSLSPERVKELKRAGGLSRALRLSAQRPLASLEEDLPAFRQAVSARVPESFSWWVEIDADVGVSVNWFWLGHVGVSYVGRVYDFDLSILFQFLEKVDWEQEISLSVESVEAFERGALEVAQKNRRAKIDGSNCPPAELPVPPPLSLEGKKHQVRLGRADAIKSKNQSAYLKSLTEPSAAEIANDTKPKDGSLHYLNLPEFGLTRTVALSAQRCVWESFDTWDALQHEFYKFPVGTFVRCSFGFSVPAGCGVQWVGETIESLFTSSLSRQDMPVVKAQFLSTEQFLAERRSIINRRYQA